MTRNILLLATFAISASSVVHAQRLGEGVQYKTEVSLSGATGEHAPLWLSANRDGLSSVADNSAYVLGGIERRIEHDSLRHWKIGYGAEIAVPYHFTSKFVPHQAYFETQYKKFRLGVGSKVRELDFKNDALSMGGMTFSRNARPVPQVRLELADWWNFTGKAHFMSFKGHVAYGMLSDGRWQEDFVGGEGSKNLFCKRVLYHSKAGYFRLGDPKRFPLTGMFGLEMVAQFGGEAWNLVDRGGTDNNAFAAHQQLGHSLRDFWDAFVPGGADVNDGAFSNVAGNQLGSWMFSLDWNMPDWGIRAYVDHFFEDHSMMFFQYGWRDNLIGLEARFPRNPVASHVVYEFLNTMDQSGGVYHDATGVLKPQISGMDHYYKHHVYGAYQHWGQVMGNPLLLSPIYNADGSLLPRHSRVRAHHVGLSGTPNREVSWRLLFTHHRSLGSYELYYDDARSTFVMGEVSYAPQRLNGVKFKIAFGNDGGNLLGSSQGFMATVTKTGAIKRRKK